MCGCGLAAPLSKTNEPSRGYFIGQPLRYIQGHQTRPSPERMQSPNPNGMCMCGCGRKTQRSKYTSLRDGRVRGEYGKFLRGHATQLNPRFAEARSRAHQKALERTAPRRKRVLALCAEGIAPVLIAHMLDLDYATVANDMAAMRRNGVEIPLLRYSLERHYALADILWIEKAWADGVRLDDVAANFGWTRQQVTEIFRRLRREGYALPLRTAPDELGYDRRALGIAYRKACVDAETGEDRKVLLRLMQVAARPVGVPTMRVLCELLGRHDLSSKVSGLLRGMQKASLVERVEATPRRVRWFVPLDQERSTNELTLADAERETELAALIREQENDVERGHWATSDGTVSLDMQVGDGGSTLYDLVGGYENADGQIDNMPTLKKDSEVIRSPKMKRPKTKRSDVVVRVGDK